MTERQSKKARKLIRATADLDMLKWACTASDGEFAEYGERVDLAPAKDGRPRFYYYGDNGAKVLAVAHLDSVCETRRCEVTATASGLLVTSPTLDDRLGAWVILDLLPRLGVEVDWLLTTGEEVGDSTAADFQPPDREYRWMFSFDRGGTDVVAYDYESPELVSLVEATGATVGMGSFSDICYLDHLGCAGVNWGVGYRDYHGPRGHAWLEDTYRSVGRFLKFYQANADTFLAWDPWPASWSREREPESWEVCLCGEILDQARGWFCPECDAAKLARWDDDYRDEGVG